MSVCGALVLGFVLQTFPIFTVFVSSCIHHPYFINKALCTEGRSSLLKVTQTINLAQSPHLYQHPAAVEVSTLLLRAGGSRQYQVPPRELP